MAGQRFVTGAAAAFGGTAIGLGVLLAAMHHAPQPAVHPTVIKPVPTAQTRHTVGQVGYWKDPSIDPKLLERAYLGTQQPLPPEARPKTLSIHPPAQKQKRLRKQIEHGDTLIY